MFQRLVVLHHLQVETGVEGIGGSTVGVQFGGSCYGQMGIGLSHVVQNLVVDALNGGLGVGSSDVGAEDKGYATAVGSCSGSVGVAVVVNQVEVIHGAQHAALSYQLLTLGVATLGQRSAVLDNEVEGGDAAITVVIGALILVVE